MEKETTIPVVGETPTATVTVQGIETQEQVVNSEQSDSIPDNTTPEEKPPVVEVTVEEIKLNEKDPTKTFHTLRDIADTATKAAKAKEEEIIKLQNELKAKEIKESEAKGEFEQLYRDTLTQVVQLQTTNKDLESKLTNAEKDRQKEFKPFNDTINHVVDTMMDELGWDEDAKSVIDPADKVTAVDRWNQFNKIRKVVKSSNKVATPGSGPSPIDVRETENDKPVNENQALMNLNSLIHYG